MSFTVSCMPFDFQLKHDLALSSANNSHYQVFTLQIRVSYFHPQRFFLIHDYQRVGLEFKHVCSLHFSDNVLYMRDLHHRREVLMLCNLV